MIFFGLLLVFCFEYLRPGNYVSALGILNTAVPVAVFSLSWFAKGSAANIDILKDRNGRLLLFFLFLIVLSVLTAEVTYPAFDKFKAVFGYILLFFMIAKLLTSVQQFRTLFGLLILIHVILLILNPDVVLQPETRSYLSGTTFLNDGNDFGWSLSIVIPMCLFFIQEERKLWKKVIYITALVMLLLALIGTQSRGATLALAAIILYQWVRSRKKVKGFVGIILLIGTILAYAPSAYFSRMETITDYENESSAQARLTIWGTAIRMANDHPFLGVGAGSFPTAYGTKYRPAGATATSLPWQNAHSMYFMLLGELGYPGLLFILAFFFLNWRANQQRIREISQYRSPLAETHRRLLVCIDSSLIGFAVAGAFLSGIYYPHLYVLAGLSAAVAFQYRRAMAELSDSALPNEEEHTGISGQDVPTQRFEK